MWCFRLVGEKEGIGKAEDVSYKKGDARYRDIYISMSALLEMRRDSIGLCYGGQCS